MDNTNMPQHTPSKRWTAVMFVVWPLQFSEENTNVQSERSWDQIPAGRTGWPGLYNNEEYSARQKTIFELNPVIEGKQGTNKMVNLL